MTPATGNTATGNPLNGAPKIDARRYDLDWLRVIAFGLLIFYHIGMYYVSWGWHVKSPHAGPFAEPLMILLNPWRLPLLFLISGVALKFAVDKAHDKAQAGFTQKRFFRLFIPLIAGSFLIVPPQSYFELLANGEITPGFFAFYQKYISADQSFSIILPTWNHLWYVAYMLVYTMLVLPLMPLIGRWATAMDTPGFERLMTGGRVLFIPGLLFVLYRFTTDSWFPDETHALVDDWGAHARYFSYFLIGILLAKNSAFWRAVANARRAGPVVAISLALVLSLMWANRDWVIDQPLFLTAAQTLRPLYAWVVIAALLALAQQHLNHKSPLLAYLTTAIFAFYILHQTIIVVAGVWLSSFNLPVAVEFLALVVITFGGCYILYEFVIRRIGFLRPLFGVPRKN